MPNFISIVKVGHSEFERCLSGFPVARRQHDRYGWFCVGERGEAKSERAVPGGVGAEGPCHPAPSPFHLHRLTVGLFVSFGKFEKHDFLALVVDIVEHPVRADSQPILSGEL